MQDILDRPATAYMNRLFVVVDEGTDVASAVRQMQSQKAQSIIVTRHDLAVGMVTDSDIIDKVVMKGEDSESLPIKEVMSSPVVTLTSKGTVKQALQQMRVNKVKKIPITDHTGIVGIVTQASLADAIRTSVLERTIKKAKAAIKDQYKPVLGNLGVMLQFSGVLLVVPALVGTLMGEAGSITGIYLEVVGLSFAGFFLMSYGERGQMNLKQASIFIVASFIVMSLFGALPYVYLNPFMPGMDASSLFVNSLFESASGFTTTGLSMITQPENLPESFNFYRSYTQWVGGLSFVYLVMMLFFPEDKLSAMKSVLGGGMLKFKEFLVTLVVIFSVYTLILVSLVIFSTQIQDLRALSLVFSTISGGGFVPASDILFITRPEFLAVVSGGMVLSALPFAFHYYIFSRKGLFSKKTLGPEVKAYLIVMAASIPVFYFLSAGIAGLDWQSAAFHVVSASTNTGFQYLNVEPAQPAAKIFLIVIMLVGGTSFSTAGGIKIGRFVILYYEFAKRMGTAKEKEESEKQLRSSTSYSSISSTGNRYRGQENGSSNNGGGGFLGRIRDEDERQELKEEITQKSVEFSKILRDVLRVRLVREILLIIGLYITLSLVTGAALSSATGRSFEDGLFESVSALSTTGLTTGITSLDLDAGSKLLLVANMILGRFEIIAIFYIFFSSLRK